MLTTLVRTVTTQAPRVLGATPKTLGNGTQRRVGASLARRHTRSVRYNPPSVRTQVRSYMATSSQRRYMSTSNGGNRRPTTGLTPGTSGRTRSASSPSTGGSNAPASGSLSSAVVSFISSAWTLVANALGANSTPPLPTVPAERANQVYAYLGSHGHMPESRQPFRGDAQAAFRFHEQRAHDVGTSLGVPPAVAQQLPPEVDLAMQMYQLAPTEGGSVDDTAVPLPFNGRDFNQALRGDAPLTPEAGRGRDTPVTSKEKLIAGLELRVLTTPTPTGEPKVYARTLADNAHNAELLRKLNAGEPVTDAGVISVTTKVDALAPAMYLISVDNAFVDPHGPNANDLARAEKEHMAVGQVLVKIGEHNGVPVVAAYTDKAVHADAMGDIARHFTFTEGTLETAVGTQGRRDRADTAKALVDTNPGGLLAQARAQLPTAPPPATA